MLRSLPVLLALAFSASSLAADYVQAPGSSLVFAGTYQGVPFTGRFPGFRTTLSFDPAAPETAQLDVTIPLTGVTTDNDDYDGEMRGSAFFDIASFATARYTATGFRHIADNRYQADGTLDLRGVSRPVTLDITWTPGGQPVLQGSATISRLAFGVGSGSWTNTSLIPDEIEVRTRVTFLPAAAE